MKQTTSKRIASLFVCFLIVQAMLMGLDLIFEVAPGASGITITVDDSGGADYTTIQEGVDAAGDGDTVYVYSGIYYEHITISGKSITLTGENRDTAIIDGSGSGYGIDIFQSVTLQKFTIQNATYGIRLGENCFIDNNRIQSMSSDGITIPGFWNIVSNNIITDCNTGIAVSHENTIKGNTIINCQYGMYLGGIDCYFYSNIISAYVAGLWVDNYKSYISQNNTVNGETVYHFYNVHGTPSTPITLNNLVLDNSNISTIGKISLIDCSHFEIINNDLSNNLPGSGVFVYSSENVTIEGNSIFNNTKGIYSEDNNDLTIENNNISINSEQGIFIYRMGYRGVINLSIG